MADPPEALVLAIRLFQRCDGSAGWLDVADETKAVYLTSALVMLEAGKQIGDIVPPITEEARDRLGPRVQALLAYGTIRRHLKAAG